MEEYNEYLEFAKTISNYAKEVMLDYFYRENKESNYKGDNTIVTIADKKINEYLIEQVKLKYPTHSVYGEEEQLMDENSEYVWVCDPIDGTVMFARNVPVACFSLALVKNGKPIVGVVNDPFTNSEYYAVKGMGAYKNGKKIHVNNNSLQDKEACMNVEMWKDAKINLYDFRNNLKDDIFMTNIGSVVRACMLVATGDYVAEVFPGIGKNHYDVAASVIIIEEAGGKTSSLYGENQRYDGFINGTILSNGIVHNKIVEEIAKIK